MKTLSKSPVLTERIRAGAGGSPAGTLAVLPWHDARHARVELVVFLRRHRTRSADPTTHRCTTHMGVIMMRMRMRVGVRMRMRKRVRMMERCLRLAFFQAVSDITVEGCERKCGRGGQSQAAVCHCTT